MACCSCCNCVASHSACLASGSTSVAPSPCQRRQSAGAVSTLRCSAASAGRSLAFDHCLMCSVSTTASIDCSLSPARPVRTKPPGPKSKIQARVSTTGKPSASTSTTSRNVQPGSSRPSRATSVICRTSQLSAP